MDLHEFIRLTTIINRLAKRALFAEKQMVALEGRCKELWRQLNIVTHERDTLRKERDGLLTQVQDMRAAIEALTEELRKEREAHAETAESLAFRLETERLQMGKDVERLTKERDGLMIQVQDMRAEIERLKKPARKHPVAVGEWVKRTGNFCHWGRSGELAQVQGVRGSSYRVQRQNEDVTDWDIVFCEPCDPPEATHDTPEGKAAAESAVKREPKPGDVVRLVRIPTPGPDFDGFIDFPWNTDWGVVGDVATVVATLVPPNLPVVAVRVSSGLVVWWPLSCIEIVEDAK